MLADAISPRHFQGTFRFGFAIPVEIRANDGTEGGHGRQRDNRPSGVTSTLSYQTGQMLRPRLEFAFAGRRIASTSTSWLRFWGAEEARCAVSRVLYAGYPNARLA